MIDNARKPIEGHFKLEQFKNGVLIDTYEDNNKIMEKSKRSMAYSMAGTEHLSSVAIDDEPKYISSFALGGSGGQTGNLLAPRDFEYTRTEMFSQEDSSGFWPITWNPEAITDPEGLGGDATWIAEGYDSNHTGTLGTNTSVNIKIEESEGTHAIIYEIKIYEDTANGDASGAAIAYTEAALYSNMNRIQGTGGVNQQDDPDNMGTIFAMRTFPAKVKDGTTSFKITWKVIF